MTAEQIKGFIRAAQARFGEIDHTDWDDAMKRYRTPSTTVKWRQAAADVVPAAEWREMVRVLAQGQSYYDGDY